MFDQLIDTINYHTNSALEIDQRVREREEQLRRLEAEYGTRMDETRKPILKGLTALLTSLFSLSI
jgi:hypothetical protein